MITKRRVVNTPADLVALIGPVGDKTMEVFGIILLDKNQRFMGLNELEDDGQTMPALQATLVGQADSVILFSVRPSGVKVRPEPRDAEKKKIDAFVDAFESVDVLLIDFLIVGWDRRSYFSFLESEMMPLPFGDEGR
jgi:DNA repair protein RadC